MVGIYKITNTENGKIYVGQSNDIQRRTFQAILWGRTYTNLPIYKKKQGIWINN